MELAQHDLEAAQSNQLKKGQTKALVEGSGTRKEIKTLELAERRLTEAKTALDTTNQQLKSMDREIKANNKVIEKLVKKARKVGADINAAPGDSTVTTENLAEAEEDVLESKFGKLENSTNPTKGTNPKIKGMDPSGGSAKGTGAGPSAYLNINKLETLNFAITVVTSAIAVWQISRSLKTAGYSYQPTQFNDHLGTFIVEAYDRGLFRALIGEGWEYRKTYITGRPGYTEQITKKQYFKYTEESHRLYGYLDWTGDFVPGEKQKAPIINFQ